jgi:PIN domain nuclease of toxin-antitoxin system
MRLLLDTHVLLWYVNEPARLSRKMYGLIGRSESWVSAVSLWEIAIKAASGRLLADPEEILQVLEPTGLSLLPVSGAHAVRVFSLGEMHGDPFDRLLVAQALVEGMVLLTYDEKLATYGSSVLLAD